MANKKHSAREENTIDEEELCMHDASATSRMTQIEMEIPNQISSRRMEEEDGGSVNMFTTGEIGRVDDCSADKRSEIGLSSYYCPICLGSYFHNSDSDDKSEETGVTFCANKNKEEKTVKKENECNNDEEDSDDSQHLPVRKSMIEPVEETENIYHAEHESTNCIDSNKHGGYKLEACQHTMCRSCLFEYCRGRISDGILEIPCCYPVTSVEADDVPCNVALTERDIRRLITSSQNDLDGGDGQSLLQKYERFKFDKMHGDSCRRCPTCDAPYLFTMIADDAEMMPISQQLTAASSCSSSVASGSLDDANDDDDNDNDGKSNDSNTQHKPSLAPYAKSKPLSPNATCRQCQTTFCYYHSNAHPNSTCEQYELISRQNNSKSNEYIAKNSKPCPTCQAPIQKHSGCNQMKCSYCNTSFCWLCLKVISDSTFPHHYQWWNLNGCPNLQMMDDGGGVGGEDANRWHDLRVLLRRLFSVFQLIVIGIPSAVLSVVSTVLCCCCISCFGNGHLDRMMSCFSCWGNGLTMLLMLPFAILGLLLNGIVWLFRKLKHFTCRMTGCGPTSGSSHETSFEATRTNAIAGKSFCNEDANISSGNNVLHKNEYPSNSNQLEVPSENSKVKELSEAFFSAAGSDNDASPSHVVLVVDDGDDKGDPLSSNNTSHHSKSVSIHQ